MELILDLSGTAGLSSQAFGDVDMVIPRPDRVLGDDSGEMAGGKFNSYLRKGYLAPNTTTSISLTSQDTLSSPLTSVLYDQINNDIYWSGVNNKLYKQTSLTDTSLEVDTTLDSGIVINDIAYYEVDSKPALLYTYDYPTDTTNKERSIFLGFKGLVQSEVPIQYRYDPVATGDELKAFEMTTNGVTKLAGMVTLGQLDNYTKEKVEISDIFLRLKRSTDDEIQSWTMKLSIYSANYTQTADGKNHDIPSTLLASTTLSSSVLDNEFQDIQFTLSTPLDITAYSTVAVVLEPETPGDITGNRGVSWLAGNYGSTSSINGLYYDDGWYQVTEENTCRFSLSLGLRESSNLIDKDTEYYFSNFYSTEGSTLASGEYTTPGNISESVTIGAKNSNIVVAILVTKSLTDVVTGATIGGEAMTRIYSDAISAGVSSSRIYVYYKEGVPPGTQTFTTTGISVESKYVIQAFYGIKPGTITINQSVNKTSGVDEDDGLDSAGGSGYRGIGIYAGTIKWYDASGPDYYRAYPGGTFSYPGFTSTSSPGLQEKPMYTGYWNTGSQPIVLYGPSLRTRSYNNGNFDSIFDEQFAACVISIQAESYETETDYYWSFKGKRSGKAFIRNSSNGLAYIFSDKAIHSFDGRPFGGGMGTITKNIIEFPDYFTITDAVDYRSRLYILVNNYEIDRFGAPTINNYSGKCGIYIWGRDSTRLGDADFIELPGAREGRSIYASPDGQLRLISIADDGMVELRQFGYNDSGGVVFPVKKTLGIGAFPMTPNGVKTYADKTVWIGNDGNMYCDKNGAVSIIYEIKTPASTSTGAMTNITAGALTFGSGDETGSTGYRSNKNAITFSYKDGGDVYIKKIYPFDLKTGNNSNQTPHKGDVYTGVKMMPITSKVNQVRVYNAPTANSGSTAIATVKLYFNQSTSATMPNGMTKTVTLDEAKRGYVDFHINKQYVHAIQIEVEWATDTPIGDDMYMPSYAVISYEDTKTKSPDNG